MAFEGLEMGCESRDWANRGEFGLCVHRSSVKSQRFATDVGSEP